MKTSLYMCLMVLASAATAPGATAGSSYISPKLAAGDVEIRKACVMPAEGKLSKLGMKGREGMSKESEEWSTTLQTVVETHLKDAGIEILAGGMSPEELEKNEELRQAVVTLQSKYEAISAQITKHPKDTRKGRFTVGDEVALLPCSARADSLIYIQGQGQVLTGGKKAFGWLVTGQTQSLASMTIAIVDAKSGDVLAFLKLLNNGKFVDDSEKAYGKRLDKLFEKMKIGRGAVAKGKTQS